MPGPGYGNKQLEPQAGKLASRHGCRQQAIDTVVRRLPVAINPEKPDTRTSPMRSLHESYSYPNCLSWLYESVLRLNTLPVPEQKVVRLAL
eukprot:12932485-Heterocapsa_arctica.AAC.1